MSRLLPHTVGCPVGGVDLFVHVSDEYAMGLVVFGAVAHIRLV